MIALLYINVGILCCFAWYFILYEILGLECMLIDDFTFENKGKIMFSLIS